MAADWKSLPGGRELDRVIAERLGMNFRYVVEVKDYVVHQDELSLWQREYLDSVYIKSDWCYVPHFTTNANAHLPLETGATFEMVELWTGKSQARIVVTVTGKSYPWQEGDTLAEARARAWLAWQDQEGERDDTVGR